MRDGTRQVLNLNSFVLSPKTSFEFTVHDSLAGCKNKITGGFGAVSATIQSVDETACSFKIMMIADDKGYEYIATTGTLKCLADQLTQVTGIAHDSGSFIVFSSLALLSGAGLTAFLILGKVSIVITVAVWIPIVVFVLFMFFLSYMHRRDTIKLLESKLV